MEILCFEKKGSSSPHLYAFVKLDVCWAYRIPSELPFDEVQPLRCNLRQNITIAKQLHQPQTNTVYHGLLPPKVSTPTDSRLFSHVPKLLQHAAIRPFKHQMKTGQLMAHPNERLNQSYLFASGVAKYRWIIGKKQSGREDIAAEPDQPHTKLQHSKVVSQKANRTAQAHSRNERNGRQ
jgi:hypothetical protein